MRTITYYKLENLYKRYKGYISTKELLNEGFSNRQIADLVKENYLERVCYGHYWMMQCGHKKPKDYKCIEVCLGSQRAVIAMKSACFYQEIIDTEPEVLIVATERTDRSKMKMRFPVERHYFSDSNFRIGLRSVKTEFGSYNIYNVERSICDMIRLKNVASWEGFLEEISCRIMLEKEQHEQILRYAKMLRMNNMLPTFKNQQQQSYGKV